MKIDEIMDHYRERGILIFCDNRGDWFYYDLYGRIGNSLSPMFRTFTDVLHDLYEMY